jgi:ribosomal protein S18 acetylase RimI-like enzyme
VSELPENVVLRDGTELDDNFIYSSWLKSYKRSAGPIPFRWYYKIYQTVLDRLFKRPPIKVRVACFRTRPEQIFGYVVFEEHEGTPYIHYLYIKDAFRGMGIGSALLSDATGGNEFTYTFRPRRHKMFVDRGGRFSDKYIREDLEA